MTSLASAAFSRATLVPVDLLRIAMLVAVALVGGLLIWEVRLRWHDRAVWYQLAAALVFGAPLIGGETRAFGTAPTWRLLLVCVGVLLVGCGVLRARRLRHTAAAVHRQRLARFDRTASRMPVVSPVVARGVVPFRPQAPAQLVRRASVPAPVPGPVRRRAPHPAQ
jgi:hypothetical protein